MCFSFFHPLTSIFYPLFRLGPPQPVAKQIKKKKKIVAQIPWPKTPGFRPKPEHPGQSQPLHPGRSVGFHSRIDIKSKSNGQDHASLEQMLMAFDPGLLLGRAETHPDEIRCEPLQLS